MTEAVFRADPYAARCEARVVAATDGGVVLDRTVFYPMGGGQPGDRGRLILTGGNALEVVEARKGNGDAIVHRLTEAAEPADVGATLTAEIDWPRRHRLMRMHSALHLLCAAIGRPVTGGQVGEQKSRLDFYLQGDAVDKEEIAARVTRWIDDDRPVSEHWIEAGELQARPELVKTMVVRPPATGGRIRLIEIEGVDLQACGGTHVRTTREIGRVQIGKIENKGRQNRRIALALEN